MMRLFIAGVIACAVLLGGMSARGFETEYAVIIGEEVRVFSRPTMHAGTVVTIDGNGEMKEAVCILNRLEEPETIDGVTDHWYFIRYRGVEGWIFGTYLLLDDKEARKSLVEVPSYFDRINSVYEDIEEESFKNAARTAEGIVSDIEANFSRQQIENSPLLLELILTALVTRGEALVYLGKYDDAHDVFDYLTKAYPDARMELEAVTVDELVVPYLSYIACEKDIKLFENPGECRDVVIAALEGRDLQTLSDMAIPGIFEIWMAYTDWVVKLGDESLTGQTWLTDSFDDAWQIIEVDTLTDRTDDVSGYCVVTGPWKIDYFGRQVNRADFCIDRVPGTGKYAFTYLILYSPPDEGATPGR
ncbi:MAG: hypothetical protein JW885_02130 [Deltaproteobacteria bacterium]|nr:hypothetical protein [Candidatus Zymogenaceae bacterium]